MRIFIVLPSLISQFKLFKDMSEKVVYTSKEQLTVLVAACSGIFIMPLMSTMMNLALVYIGDEYTVGSHSLAMINTIFLLASVITMVPLAKLSDIYGRKKIFLFGLIVVAIAATGAALSPTFEILLIMRFLMGVGSAAISVSSISLVTEIFPFSKRGWAIGVYTTFVYLGLALGPTLGGFISQILGWRYNFVFMFPLAVISLISLFRFKKDVISSPDLKMDVKGSAVYALTIFFTMYGIINLPETWAFVLMIIGISFLMFFISLMKKSKSPVLDIEIFKHKLFSRSCIAAFMNYASSYSVSFFLALYLQEIGALSAVEAGMIMLIQPVIQVILTTKAGSYSDKISDKRLLPTLGMALTTLGAIMIIFLDIDVNLYYVAVILFILGLGFALFSAPNTSLMMSSLPYQNRGVASGMVAVVRQVGMMVSMGIAMCCISVIMGSTNNLNPATYGEFINVIRVAFIICSAMCIIGTVVSWFRGKDSEAEVQEL